MYFFRACPVGGRGFGSRSLTESVPIEESNVVKELLMKVWYPEASRAITRKKVPSMFIFRFSDWLFNVSFGTVNTFNGIYITRIPAQCTGFFFEKNEKLLTLRYNPTSLIERLAENSRRNGRQNGFVASATEKHIGLFI